MQDAAVASKAKQSKNVEIIKFLDCFVVSLLSMTSVTHNYS